MARYIMLKLEENMFDEPLQDILDKIDEIEEVQDVFLYNKAEEISPAWEGATEADMVKKDIRKRDRDYTERIKNEIQLDKGQASHL